MPRAYGRAWPRENGWLILGGNETSYNCNFEHDNILTNFEDSKLKMWQSLMGNNIDQNLRVNSSSKQTVIYTDDPKAKTLSERIRDDWKGLSLKDDLSFMFFDIKEEKYFCMVIMNKKTFDCKLYSIPAGLRIDKMTLRGVSFFC